MKIAFFEVQDFEKEFFKGKFVGHEVRFFVDVLNTNLVSEIEDFEIISTSIYSNLNRQLLSKLPKIRLIATRSTGFDHIDLEECRRRGIAVCNVPLYCETTVAEHTFALILSLSRRIHNAYERTRQGNFSCEGLQGFDLRGKVLGVVGTGHIGSVVIRMANGFGMKVLAYDKYPSRELQKELEFEYVDLKNLLQESDILTLHLPMKPETYHFLNRERISAMKEGAIVVNTARGELMDTEALTEALMKGRLGGAGLDVLEEEAQFLFSNLSRERFATLPKNLQILLRLENVVITPHYAFNSVESLRRLIKATIENIISFLSGTPQNLVT